MLPNQLITGLHVTDQASYDEAVRMLANSPALTKIVWFDRLEAKVTLGVVPDVRPAGSARVHSHNKAAERTAYDRQALLQMVVVLQPVTTEGMEALRHLGNQCGRTGIPLLVIPPPELRAVRPWPKRSSSEG